MMTPREIIDAFPSKAAFGRACGFTKDPGKRAWDMHRRNSIRARYWRSIVAEAKRIDRRDITLTALAMAHAPAPTKEAAE